MRLARLSMETYVQTGKRLKTLPADLPAEMTDHRAGAFVSLHIHGQLRGCIGTTEPTTGSVALEIVQNAVSACSRDPRFPPVTVSEMGSLEQQIDIARQKGGIRSNERYTMERFEVVRHT